MPLTTNEKRWKQIIIQLNYKITKLVQVRQQCSNRETKEEVFRAAFGNRAAKEHSYFLHHSDFVEADLALPQPEDLESYDKG